MLIKDALGSINNKAIEGRERTQNGRSEKNAKASSNADAQSGDRVQFSDRGKDLVKASEVLANTPEVRADKISEIKRRIENNDYTVDAEQVASRMIMSFLKEVV